MQSERALTPVGMLKAQWSILHALMLRNIKTRLGGNEFGFLAMGVGWPLSHILILIIINTGLGRAAPYGDSAALWFATGVIPFMAFSYMSRFIMMGVVLNRPLLTFPVVKVTDILFASAIVEILSAGLVILIMFAIFWAFGIDFMPLDIVQASLALLAMMLLGLGWGVVNAIIAAAVPFWVTGFFLLQIIYGWRRASCSCRMRCRRPFARRSPTCPRCKEWSGCARPITKAMARSSSTGRT